MNYEKTMCFDLDDTICFPNHGESDSYKKYGLARPNDEIIDIIRRLKSYGFRIVISTARRMLTHQGDIAKIIDDIGDITKNWLTIHDVPYDDLVFGKPYSSTFYVDDKAITPIELKKWMIETYENDNWKNR